MNVGTEKFIKCSICNSLHTRKLIEIDSARYIYQCQYCRNAFTHPMPRMPDYASEDFHGNGKITDTLLQYGDLPEEIQQSYDIQVKLIEEHLNVKDPILEIGGGEGIFLDLLLQRGHNVEMSEPSLRAATRARKRGLKVYNEYFQKVKFDKMYSLVLMAHVLEHIQNPLKVMEDLKLLLKPGGYLMLTQTNFKGFMPRFLRQHWYAWVPDQHFSHFSIKGLKYLAKKSNFKFIDYRYSRLYHGKSIYHKVTGYIPFLQDQIHVLLKLDS